MVVERWESCSWSHTGFWAWERENYKVGVASIRYYRVSKCHSNSYTLPYILGFSCVSDQINM